jgi:pantoate--beta-alanine ligase
MRLCHTIAEMRAACRASRQSNKRLGFVPTMGALHQGHLSLVQAAKANCDTVAASIFVNPTQFAPTEDLAKYPRNFAHDSELLEKEGVAFLFAPSAEEMFPAGAVSWVTVDGLSEKLDGKSRPAHFRGVTTVVAKLFHIVEPDAAFFGQKDAAQLAIIRKMAHDLNFPVEIIACPIVRDKDGLALSSRNSYLDATQRAHALALSRALTRIRDVWQHGEADPGKLLSDGREVIEKEKSVRLDYLELIDPNTLDPMPKAGKGALVAIAAWIGTTRLIDNILL